ncbi:MAG: anti-sigma factor family protein [Rhodothermales bacterium]
MDELLCEYVDGTMDPTIRRAFEEYIAANPDLAAHVASLKHTRALLCRYRSQIHAPMGFAPRLHRELTDEMMQAQAPMFTDTSQRLRKMTSLTSAVMLALMAGLVYGTLLYEQTNPATGNPLLMHLDERPVIDRQTVTAPVYPLINQSSFGSIGRSLLDPGTFTSSYTSSPDTATALELVVDERAVLDAP